VGIFWNNDIKVDLLAYSQYHIDVILTEGANDPWRLTCVYGEAQTSERHKTRDLLKFVKSASHLPWVCMGDFNEVLHQLEHVGVQERSHAQIAGFWERLTYADFMILVMKDAVGLLRKRWREVRTVESDLTVRWHRQIGVLGFRQHN
jgi:hypothetical protein